MLSDLQTGIWDKNYIITVNAVIFVCTIYSDVTEPYSVTSSVVLSLMCVSDC